MSEDKHATGSDGRTPLTSKEVNLGESVTKGSATVDNGNVTPSPGVLLNPIAQAPASGPNTPVSPPSNSTISPASNSATPTKD